LRNIAGEGRTGKIIEVKYEKGAPYIYLTNTDLELLGPKRP